MLTNLETASSFFTAKQSLSSRGMCMPLTYRPPAKLQHVSVCTKLCCQHVLKAMHGNDMQMVLPCLQTAILLTFGSMGMAWQGGGSCIAVFRGTGCHSSECAALLRRGSVQGAFTLKPRRIRQLQCHVWRRPVRSCTHAWQCLVLTGTYCEAVLEQSTDTGTS